jgi:hypothetical protein
VKEKQLIIIIKKYNVCTMAPMTSHYDVIIIVNKVEFII